ncbi:hypothetical protein [Aquibium oceanicum]|uniref:Uncharacterized protein n=1 Tax=Aquibium oceanicum TaxID=1670800 RepID=A0A1L3SXG1_9HYPH|nr:hypothetical protein [Aquibium oceanicum]APH74117.1 hypothetical protein BSQ44_24170 [Aquibium oceanicum]
MKLNTSLANDFTSSGFGEARKFGFEMNAMAFHAVINGMYSDKILAPVREISTNAFDAHLMVDKNDVPFELMAPSTFNPYFMVRDYGPGMSQEEVETRATTAFASSKRDTNNQVGMIGIGMMSPFAYTKQYTITCYDGEFQRDYVCYLDAGEEPNVSAMEPVPSTEPRGLKVMFPVKQEDIYRFQAAISKVMIGFDPMPKILNEAWQPGRPVDLMTGSNFRIVKSDMIKRPYVRQGCVLYPLDAEQIGGEYHDNQLPIILDVPIGTASVSTSREQLGYDETTKANLAKIWKATMEDIQASIQRTLDEPTNFYDACIRYRDLTHTLPSRLWSKGLKWRGKTGLRSSFPFSGSRGATIKMSRPHGVDWITVRQPTSTDLRYGRKAPSWTPEELRDATIVVQSEDLKFAKDRLRRFRSENPGADVIWVKTDYLDSLAKEYGVEDFVDLEDYEPLKLPRTPRQTRSLKKTDIRRFDQWRSIIPGEVDEVIYVQSEGSKYKVFGEVFDYETIQRRFIEPARKVGPLFFDRLIVVLLKTQKAFAKDENWKSLEDVLQEIAGTFNPKDFQRKEEARRLFQDLLVMRLHQRKEQLPKRLQAFFDAIDEIEPVTNGEYDLSQFWQRITGKQLPDLRTYWRDRWAKLIARYPLFDAVHRNDEWLDEYLKLIAR